MDEFELQLKGLFEECADSGLLGHDELFELCERLELQRHVKDLSEALHLNNSKCKGVSYIEFRDTLISFLGPNSESPRAGGNSPSREVSPKYVFGKKKYGRRSRPDVLDCESNLVDGVEACSVAEETSVKKRRTHDDSDNLENIDSDKPLSSEEQMLVSAWSAVASPSGKLSRDQLVHVFEGVGLQNGSDEAASRVFENLELGEEGITLEALLTFIKGGTPLQTDNKSHDFTENIASVEFVDSTSGSISGNSLLELWESAGVLNGRQILQSLGVRPGQVCDMASLTSKLNAFIINAREDKPNSLLKAGIVLQRTYISSLKGVVDQMTGENEKLKADVSEANQRSQLLAQEVDDHHSQLEATTARQVKTLEQRHAERIRELTERLKSDQDQLSHQNSQLELRLAGLEAEEAQTRAELNCQQVENQQLHDEHQALVNQLTTLQNERDTLRNHVQELSLIQQRVQELEDMAKDRNVIVLLEKVSGLEEENRNLKDRNDELALQVEDLSIKLNNASIHKRGNAHPVLSLSVDAAMREVDDLGMEQDIPMSRLSDERGFESLRQTEVDHSLQGNSQDKCMVKVKEVILDTLVNSIGHDASNSILVKIDHAWSESGKNCECGQLQETILSLKDELLKTKEEDSRLKTRCNELETSLQQLQDEYESTEDYWTSKLEEERNLFDAEQKQNDEKYSELVNKIIEYEEMMKEEVTVRQRLETIEEKDSLEKQVLEMEEEYSKLIAEKDEEIDRLHQQINSHPSCVDAPAQTDLPPQQTGSESTSQHNYCRRSLTFTSGDRRKSCCKVYRLQGEIRNLLEAKQAAQREVSALLAERNLLYKQVLNQRREDSCSASLSSKLLCAERRCRTLMATLRNQQLQTAELLRNTWQQHKREVEELRGVLAVTDGKLQHQTVQIQQQLNKMAAADALVKDLFVENAHLLAAVRKLEAMQYCQHYSSQ